MNVDEAQPMERGPRVLARWVMPAYAVVLGVVIVANLALATLRGVWWDILLQFALAVAWKRCLLPVTMAARRRAGPPRPPESVGRGPTIEQIP